MTAVAEVEASFFSTNTIVLNAIFEQRGPPLSDAPNDPFKSSSSATNLQFVRLVEQLRLSRAGLFWLNSSAFDRGATNVPLGFKKKSIDLSVLQRVAERDDLLSILGWPIHYLDAWGAHGTIVWQWRFCNGSSGKQFRGIEITAGFRPFGSQVEFVLVRKARPEGS